MSWASAGWWLCYAFIGVALQALLPGLDFLLPASFWRFRSGIFRRFWPWARFFVLLQEGMGSMAFGGTLLWYALAAIVFHVGCGLLQGTGFLFVALFAYCFPARII